MSNLKLPSMSYASLTSRNNGTLAYATTLTVTPHKCAEVRHHGNLIAEIGPDGLWISNAGWDSSTTANRLRVILRDNGLPYTVRIHDFEMELLHSEGPDHGFDTVARRPFREAYFRKDEKTGWTLL